MVQNVLKSAIQSEYDSYNLYMNLIKRVSSKECQQLLEKIAAEELQHAAVLEKQVPDDFDYKKAKTARISELCYLVDQVDSEASEEEIIKFAINNEDSAAELYAHLGSIARKDEIRRTFQALSGMELGHKKKLMAMLNDLKAA